jgi:hypothetical protein
VPAPAPLEAPVIFRPVLDGLPRITQRYFGRLALSDHGDHVEWTDGKRTTRMRLPDQPDAGAGYPVLDSVLLAAIKGQPYVPNRITTYYIRFLDPHGAVITWFGPRGDTLAGIVPRILPEPEVYEPLLARGVRVQHEEYRDLGSLYAAHPDPRVQGFSLSFARNPMLWIGGPVLTVVVIVLIVMAAMGKFSS